ncbi:hypothetical protein AAHH86_00115 [Candidatus Hodgkinia cicadicola]
MRWLNTSSGRSKGDCDDQILVREALKRNHYVYSGGLTSEAYVRKRMLL